MKLIQSYICAELTGMRALIILFVYTLPLFAEAQNSSELDKRNGFKDIKLLTDISTLEGLEYWKAQKDKPKYDLYKNTKEAYRNIGNVKVFKVTVYTYRNLAYKIEVISEKDEKLFRSLEKAFGKIKYSMGSQVSYWAGEHVRLTYESVNAGKIKLTYSAHGINQIIASDKKKAVDSLSSEF
jgi:hypothetical protein